MNAVDHFHDKKRHTDVRWSKALESVWGNLQDADAFGEARTDLRFMQVRHVGFLPEMDNVDQGRLNVLGGSAPQPSNRRLWIVASDRPLDISNRHHYFVLDSREGKQVFSGGDLFLLRMASGAFILFGARGIAADEAAAADLCASVPQHIARVCSQPGSRSPIQEMLILSSKTARGNGQGGLPRQRRESARTPLEVALFRLAMMPVGRGDPGTVTALGKTVGDGAHPLVSSLFLREFADASAWTFASTGDPEFAREALGSYQQVARLFDTIGMHHQSRASIQNAISVTEQVDQLLLPGFKPVFRPGRTIGFSAERLCGFALNFDGVPVTSGPKPSHEAQIYQAIGHVPLSDTSLLQALSGLSSPSRRIVTSAQLDGDVLTVTAGVFDEMRALLRVDLVDPDHSDVAAIRIASNTVQFDEAPWTIRPQGKATFTGRLRTRQRRHRLRVRATMERGNTVYLTFHVGADDRHLRFFS